MIWLWLLPLLVVLGVGCSPTEADRRKAEWMRWIRDGVEKERKH